MAGGNNPKKKKRKTRQGNVTENEERKTMLQSVWGCFQALLRLLICLLSALITGMHILNWIPQMLVLLFFHLAWIMLVCVQSGLYLLARVLSVCLQLLLFVLPWTVWLFMLIEGVDLGCSIIRLIVLAVPFIMSKWFVWSMQLMVKSMWPSWMLRLLQGKWSSTGQTAATLISVGEYLDGRPATMSHPTYQFQIPTKEGRNLWQGFIDIVLNAYEGKKSWAGTFTKEHLRMCGSECRIELEPSYPATFENLLLDLAQIAALLLEYFETPNQLAPRCIKELHSAMTTPWLGPIPAPSAQQIENFLKFMRNQPGLKPARTSSTFLTKVFQARRGMGAIEKATVDAAIANVSVPLNWMHNIPGLGYPILTRTVCFVRHRPNNGVPVYKPTAEEFFRFLRNLFEHGGDLDANGMQMVSDMEDIDYIAAEVFPDIITQFVWNLVMNVDMMTGLLKHAWEDYQ